SKKIDMNKVQNIKTKGRVQMILAEKIGCMVAGIALALLLLFIWLLFNKRKKLAFGLSVLFLIFYLCFYVYLLQTTENQSGLYDRTMISTIEKTILNI